MATKNFSSNFLSFCVNFFFLLCFFTKSYAYDENLINLHDGHFVVQISSLLPSSICTSSIQGIQEKGSSLEVVHKHGPCNKLNQDNQNASPNHIQILHQDQSRVNAIHSRLQSSTKGDLYEPTATSVPIQSGKVIGSGNYIVTVGLGTPKKDLTLIFDTGSGLTWTQCQPCVSYCHKQKDSIFDPRQSSTYSNVTCKSPMCTALGPITGVTPGCSASTCVYGIQYGDQSLSVGFFGKEKLTLGSDAFDNLYFGCGQDNEGLFGSTAGLLGLAKDSISFVSQTAQKYGKYFSYCLPSKVSLTGHLSFGKGSKLSSSLKFTPLISDPKFGFYFMKTIGISVGGKRLPISAPVFSNSGTLIDSGTVVTRLPPSAYTALKSAFRALMKGYPLTDPLSILDTCYDFSKFKNITVPQVGFFFAGDAEVTLHWPGIFYVSDISKACLAFAPNSDDSNVAIFGNTQQLTFDVVYDVAGGRLGFGPGGCS